MSTLSGNYFADFLEHLLWARPCSRSLWRSSVFSSSNCSFFLPFSFLLFIQGPAKQLPPPRLLCGLLVISNQDPFFLSLPSFCLCFFFYTCPRRLVGGPLDLCVGFLSMGPRWGCCEHPHPSVPAPLWAGINACCDVPSASLL